MTDETSGSSDVELPPTAEKTGQGNRERDVLSEVVSTYPKTMTREELVRELIFASASSSERDSVETAIRDLAASGLLHSLTADEVVRPTRAAVKYFELMGL